MCTKLPRIFNPADLKLDTVCFTTKSPQYDTTKRKKCLTDNKQPLILQSLRTLLVLCCYMLRRLAGWLRICIRILYYFMKSYTNTKKILFDKFYGFWDECVTVYLYDWLYLYSIAFTVFMSLLKFLST